MKFVGDYSENRNNNFDLIRFVAASLVIFSHAYPLSGYGGLEPLARWAHFTSFGTVAVRMFFSISGFLITQSFLRRDNVGKFLEARFLRIFPGLFVAICFSILVGFFASTAGWLEFFRQREVYSFFIHNITLFHIQFSLPGVFDSNPFNSGINGSLWTLPTEVQLYICVALVGFFGILSRIETANLALLFFSWVTLQSNDGYFQTGSSPEILSWSFILGSLIYVNRTKIPLSVPLGMLMSIVVFLFRKQSFFDLSFPIVLSYWTFVFAYHPKIKCHNFGKYGDFSYGLYIYAFPIEQFIASFPSLRNPLLMFAIAFPLTLFMAFLSWHIVEKKALLLKGKVLVLVSHIFNRMHTTSTDAPFALGARSSDLE